MTRPLPVAPGDPVGFPEQFGPPNNPSSKQARARAAQRDYWSKKAGRLAGQLQAHNEPMTYLPPEFDDWRSWHGLARYAALDLRYRFCCRREADLARGLGPYYCPQCEERVPDFRPLLCLDCAWDSTLHDRALKLARELARPAGTAISHWEGA